jgi:hypothetical protein
MATCTMIIMSTLQIRLMRATGLGVTLMLGGTICLLGRDWVKVVTPAHFYPRNLAIGLLEALIDRSSAKSAHRSTTN